MAYNSDLATATSMAPQLGTLSSTTTPTSTQATVIWTRAYNEVRMAFLEAGMSDSFTSSSRAEEVAQSAEMMLTSGLVLIRLARDMLSKLWHKRDYLMSNGAAAALSGTSIFAKSNWTEDSDPDFDYTVGTGDREYAQPPSFQDGDEL